MNTNAIEPVQKKKSGSHRSRKRSRRSGRKRFGIISSLGSIASWPWRRLQRSWNHWAPGKSLNQGLKRATYFAHSIVRFEGTDYAVTRSDGRMLVRAKPSKATMLNPLWWISCAGLFLWRWFLSRPFLPMLLAVPAVMAAIGLMSAISAGGHISPGSEARIYRRLLPLALDAKDIGKARLAADALLRLYPNDAELIYERALVEDAAGNQQSARLIMADLAISAKSERAALWIAASIGDRDTFGSWPQEQQKEYFRWLTIASQNAPEDPLPRRLMGNVLRFVGDTRGAYEALLPIADSDAETSYIVCCLEKQLGLMSLAMARGDKLIRVFKERLGEKPGDLNARIRYASVLVLQEREAQAIELLKGGLVLATTPDEIHTLRKTVTDAMVVEALRMARTDTSPQGLLNCCRRLKEAMAIDPTNASLLEAVTLTCLQAAESKNDEMIVLREALVQGVDSDTAHFILGTIAAIGGNSEEATQHYEVAIKSNPNLPGLLNNWAHTISQDENPDLERALKMSNAALASLPDHPYFHETRGQIYLKLGRYTDAIADLEFALSAPELRPLIRESLATAYEACGQHEIAQRQRELLEQGK